MKIVLAIAAVLMLSACATSQAIIKDKGQTVADDFARGALATPCAMTYGAFTRLSGKDKLAVEILCGGDFVDNIISRATTPSEVQ